MSGMLMLDNEMAELAKQIAPHRNILNPNIPRTINDNPSLPKTVVSNTTNWFSFNDEEKDIQINSEMNRFLWKG